MSLEDFHGTNAGKVWQVLDGKEALSTWSIAGLSGLDLENVFSALGWLGREGKIVWKQGRYSLSGSEDPEVTKRFGGNAGKVWQVLSEKGELTAEQLSFETSLYLDDVHAALGWLAREGKVSAVQGVLTSYCLKGYGPSPVNEAAEEKPLVLEASVALPALPKVLKVPMPPVVPRTIRAQTKSIVGKGVSERSSLAEAQKTPVSKKAVGKKVKKARKAARKKAKSSKRIVARPRVKALKKKAVKKAVKRVSKKPTRVKKAPRAVRKKASVKRKALKKPIARARKKVSKKSAGGFSLKVKAHAAKIRPSRRPAPTSSPVPRVTDPVLARLLEELEKL